MSETQLAQRILQKLLDDGLIGANGLVYQELQELIHQHSSTSAKADPVRAQFEAWWAAQNADLDGVTLARDEEVEIQRHKDARLACWQAAWQAALAQQAGADQTDEQYADADALIKHLDDLMDDGGQGGEKWEPAQAAIAGIRAWQEHGAPQPAIPEDMITNAYDAGWHVCCDWAKREDLHSDDGSPAYLKDRAEALRKIKGEIQ